MPRVYAGPAWSTWWKEAQMTQSAGTYEIQIREYLDSDWADWLGGMALTPVRPRA